MGDLLAVGKLKFLETMMRYRWCAVVCFGLLWSVTAFAQAPEKLTNLQYFPKDMTRKELVGIMRGFSFSLGVRCEFCHVESADKKMDFASDAKDEKRTARAMLKMADAINKDYIAKLGMTAPVQVQCVTCHRGLSKPVPINNLLAKTIEKKDVTAAIAEYKELRKKYYGSGAYDFSETPMNQLAESLLAKDKNKEAAAIMEMNVEFNSPASGWTYSVLAMSHKDAGDLVKAKADFQKLLEMNPDNKWAKEQLEELSKSK